jgi:DnaK suppressor protein
MLAYQRAPRPESAHLAPDRLHGLRARLLLEASVQSAQRRAHEAAVRQLRDLTDADSVLERELAEAGALRAQEALAEIEQALERLEAGTYGRCDECGDPVPFERLEAIPAARFCVACPGRRAAWR